MMENKARSQQFGIKGILKDIFNEWILTSTSHGLPNIFRSNSTIVKILWSVCFAICLIYSIINIGLGIQFFAENNVYITTELIQEIPTTFPAVTICNTKSTNKKVSKSYIDNLLYVNGTPIFTLTEDTYSFVTTQAYYVTASISADKNLTA